MSTKIRIEREGNGAKIFIPDCPTVHLKEVNDEDFSSIQLALNMGWAKAYDLGWLAKTNQEEKENRRKFTSGN